MIRDTTIRSTLDAFADLLGYPQEDYPVRVDAARVQIDAADSAAAGSLDLLVQFVADATRGELEERYTRTFDMNPSHALELGWHLYGEDYDRGAFLVTVRELMRTHGVEETGELPDHITHILRLVGRLEADEAERFARRQALPAVERILLNFEDEAHPFRGLLTGARDAMAAHFGPADRVPASAFACPAPYEEGPVACSGMGQSPCAPPPGTAGNGTAGNGTAGNSAADSSAAGNSAAGNSAAGNSAASREPTSHVKNDRKNDPREM